MEIQATKFSVPFVTPLKTAKAVYDLRAGLLIKLTTQNHSGLGEASPLPDYSIETLDEVIESFKKHKNIFSDIKLSDNHKENYKVFLEFLRTLNLPASLFFGLETAFLDLICKLENTTIAKWLNPSAKDSVHFNILLPSDIEKAKDEIKKHSTAQVFKYKLTRSIEADSVEAESVRVKELTGQLSNGSELRLDANQAYSFDEARQLVSAFENLPIEYIEEPLKMADFDKFIELKNLSKIPLALDESLVNLISIDRALKNNLADFYILKPSMLGGINVTLEAIKKIRAEKKEVVITSTLETETGVNAFYQTALAGELTRACGLNTLHLFKSSDFLERRL